MKKWILILAMVGFGWQSYSQEIIYRAILNKEQVPDMVLDAVMIDFPGYIVDTYEAVPIDYIEDDVYLNKELEFSDLDSYQVVLSSKGKELVANYDGQGHLMSTVEKLKNVAPPLAVSRSIASAYPGWTLHKEVYHMTQQGNKKPKDHYKLVLTKDGQRKRVFTDANGNILK